MADTELIERICTAMVAAYPNPPKTAREMDVLLQTWKAVLGDVPNESLEVAASMYLHSDAGWRPAPGQLRAKAVFVEGADTSGRAEEAWEKVKQSDFGRDAVGDPLAVNVMARLGGFEAFAQSEIEDEHFWHDRFVRLYGELTERQKAQIQLAAPAPLAALAAGR